MSIKKRSWSEEAAELSERVRTTVENGLLWTEEVQRLARDLASELTRCAHSHLGPLPLRNAHTVRSHQGRVRMWPFFDCASWTRRYQRDTCYRLERLGQAREPLERPPMPAHACVTKVRCAVAQAQEQMEALAQKSGSKLVKDIAETRQRNGKNLPRLLETASQTFTRMQTTLTNALLERCAPACVARHSGAVSVACVRALTNARAVQWSRAAVRPRAPCPFFCQGIGQGAS
jgi:hypothetical protein